MRTYSILCACLLFGLVSAWADDAAAPQAKLTEANQDHGTVFVGTKIEGKFYVENSGTVPFRVTDARPTCHCTTTVVSKDEVAPGSKAEVSYEITTAGVGKTMKTIRIVTDPPLPDQLIFTASVTFAPFIETDAKDLTVDVLQGDPVNVRVPLHIAKGIDNIKLLGATTRSRGMQALLEGPSNGADYTLVVQSTDPLPIGKRPVVVDLEFQKEEKGLQNLTVMVNILPEVQITPAPIVVTFEPDKDEVTVPITLKNSRGNSFTVKSVKAKSCTIHDVVLPTEPAAEFSIPLTFVRPDAGAALRGFITFDFGDDLGTQTIYTVTNRVLSTASKAPAASQVVN